MNLNRLKQVLRNSYTDANDSTIEVFAGPILACWQRYDINTELRQAHWIAQIGHESAQLRYTEEIASGQAYEGRRDLGNTQSGDGRRFKGRGLIQLTGRHNYTAYGKAIEKDLLSNPELVAADLYLATDVAGWYWQRTGLNTWADRDDLRTITRKINGGYNGFSDRQRLLILAKKALFVAFNHRPITARQIQSALNSAISAGLKEDGIIGPLTMAKIREFQQRNDLAVDGIVGSQTETALRRYL